LNLPGRRHNQYRAIRICSRLYGRYLNPNSLFYEGADRALDRNVRSLFQCEVMLEHTINSTQHYCTCIYSQATRPCFTPHLCIWKQPKPK